MSKRLTGLNPLAYMGVEPLTPSNTYNQMTDPTVNDFQGFNLGDIWVNKVGIRVWIYLGQDNSRQAIWLELAASGTVGASDFITDSGTAITNVSGQINVVGGTNMNTAGSGNTVTINLDETITLTGDIHLPNTSADQLSGVITVNNTPFLHSYGDNTFPNVFLGKNAGNFTLTPASAILNIGIGAGSLSSLTTGSSNIVMGYTAGGSITTGDSNIIIGSQAFNDATTASFCIAIGEGAMGNANPTDNCIGIGGGSLSNVTGQLNIAIGGSSGTDLTTGQSNLILGHGSGDGIVTGSNNIIVGNASGTAFNAAESSNIMIGNIGIAAEDNIIRLGTTGSGAGQQTTCYLAGNVHVDEGNLVLATTNTGPTVGVIYSNTDTLLHTYGSFSNNIFLGINAGNLSNVTQDNIAIGSLAGADIATGTGNNIMIGSSAGTNLTTGNHNVIIGAGAGTNYVSTESDNILIGSVTGTIGEQDVIRIGNAQTTCFIAGIRGVTTTNNDAVAVLVDSAGQLGTVSSSRVYKENIIDMRSQSEGIMSLRPVTFNYKKDERKAKHYGLIAEEVAETMPDLVVYNAEGTPETVKYHILVPLLLNEVQRMNERILELEDKNCRN